MTVTVPVALLAFVILMWCLCLVVVLPLLVAWGSRDKTGRRGSRQDWTGNRTDSTRND